jgi:hypothetical protein
LQTAIINCRWTYTALDVTVQNYPVVERHSARNGNEYHIYFTRFVARFSYRPSGCSDVPGWNCGARGVKQIFKNPQHNYTSFNCFASFSRFSIEEIAYDSGLLRG